MNENIPTITQCRFCSSPLPSAFLHFDSIAIGSVYLTCEEMGTEPYSDLSVCQCPSCGLLQLLETMPEDIYRGYKFVGSFASGYRNSIDEYLALIEQLPATAKRVVEIGANDGYLLSRLNEKGYETLGFEPSIALAQKAVDAGVTMVADYFNAHQAQEHKSFKPDGIVMRHVLEHVNDLGECMKAVDAMLADEGWLIIEVPDAATLLKEKIFTSLYHEHLVYFDIATLEKACEGFGFSVVTAQWLPVHCGSIRVVCFRTKDSSGKKRDFDPKLVPVNQEDVNGIASYVSEHINAFKESISSLMSAGTSVAGYGASQRTTTFLAMAKCPLPEDMFLVDKNETIHGLYTPGSHLPIYGPDELLRRAPKDTFIFARAYEEQIINELSGYTSAGGRLTSLKSLPLKVVSGQ